MVLELHPPTKGSAALHPGLCYFALAALAFDSLHHGVFAFRRVGATSNSSESKNDSGCQIQLVLQRGLQVD